MDLLEENTLSTALWNVLEDNVPTGQGNSKHASQTANKAQQQMQAANTTPAHNSTWQSTSKQEQNQGNSQQWQQTPWTTSDTTWPTPQQSRQQQRHVLGHHPRQATTHQPVQAFISSGWQHQPRVAQAKAVIEALANDATLPGNLVEVTEAEAVDLNDHYQAFECNQPITLFWQSNQTMPGHKTRKVRAQHKGQSQFRPIHIVYRT